MAGRTGAPVEKGRYDGIVYMPCTEENNFVPQPPAEKADLIYLCFPNNPTGGVATKQQLAGSITPAGTRRLSFTMPPMRHLSPNRTYRTRYSRSTGRKKSQSSFAAFLSRRGERCRDRISQLFENGRLYRRPVRFYRRAETVESLYRRRQGGRGRLDLETPTLHEVQRRILCHPGRGGCDLYRRRQKTG